VHDGRVDRNQQVKGTQGCRGVCEIAELRRQIGNGVRQLEQRGMIRWPDIFLHAV
jgi:hypothetical protein